MTQREYEDNIKRLNTSLEQLTQMFQLQMQQLQAQLKDLTEQLKARDEEIARLKEQLNKNNNNSSKPPSSDGYKKPAPKSNRSKSGKRPGGQNGHSGSNLFAPDVPKSYEYHMPSCCSGCPNTEECRKHGTVCASRQVVDATVDVAVIEHQQIQICKCPLNPAIQNVKGKFPEGITAPVQYGKNLQALVVALNTYGAVSIQRTHDILSGVFSLPLSVGTIQSMLRQCAENLCGILPWIREQISNSPLMNCDETGSRIAGKLNWVHFNGNEQFSLLTLSSYRGHKGMTAIGILPNYTGTIVHDCWASYWKYPQLSHAVCNAHILRELNGITENYPEQTWADDFRKMLLKMKAVVDKAHQKAKATLSYYYRRKFSQQYDDIIKAALQTNPLPEVVEGKRGRKKKGKIRALIERLQSNKEAVCLFTNDLSVPFDNNLAERGLRMTKAKFKIAGCFRTPEGCQNYLDVMSYVDSAKKHGKSAYEAIRMAVIGTPELIFS